MSIGNQLSRILAVALLGVMLASTAGAVCLLPTAHSGMMGCHSSQSPSLPRPGHSQPGHSSCCRRSVPLAFLANVSPVRAPLFAVVDDNVHKHVVLPAENRNELSAEFLFSGGPPRILSLRI
jgi:hypothetical protein